MSGINEGGTTPVHGIDVPEEYEDFTEQYFALLESVDTGLVIVEQTYDDLSQYEGGAHSDVLAFVVDEGKFYCSANGEFTEQLEVEIDFDELEEEDVEDLSRQLETEFLELAGGTMEGDIDMAGNDVDNAGSVSGDTVEADDTLVLPVK